VVSPIVLRGVDRSYTLNFASTNAICRLEESTGLSYREVLTALGRKRPKVSLLRAFVQAALIDPADVTADEAGAILDDIGGAAMIRAATLGLRRKGRRDGR
jgi:hypothetical protein